ncbi:hypothetical protein B0G38_001004 [Arthrobacter sp. VKM Ac-2550]|nr:hypothetical protein [Arthrobacter sp. VKM Ac-2550]
MRQGASVTIGGPLLCLRTPLSPVAKSNSINSGPNIHIGVTVNRSTTITAALLGSHTPSLGEIPE